MTQIFVLSLITLLIALYVQARRAANEIRRNRIRARRYTSRSLVLPRQGLNTAKPRYTGPAAPFGLTK